jgi:hypothetical protein
MNDMRHYGEPGYESLTAKWDEMQRELRYFYAHNGDPSYCQIGQMQQELRYSCECTQMVTPVMAK